MRTVAIFLAFLYASVSFSQKNLSQNSSGRCFEKVINSQWTFNYLPAADADKGYESPGFDDSKWVAISIPHTWNTYETTGELKNEYSENSISDNVYWITGWGWYRKHFSLKPEYSGRKIFVEFNGVERYCKVWLNGKYIGEHIGGGSFDLDISQDIKPGEDNVLAVAVNILRNNETKTSGEGSDSDCLYGGIDRNVKLILKDKLFIPVQGSAGVGSSFIITSGLSGKDGIIKIQTLVKNDYPQNKVCTLFTSITDNNGKNIQTIKTEASLTSGQLFKFDQTGKPVKNPHLCSASAPESYKVETKVMDGKLVTDVITASFCFGNTDEMKQFRNDAKDSTSVLLIRNIFKGLNLSGKRKIVRPESGEAVRIVLVCTTRKIPADRGSVVCVHAKIVDNKGIPVTDTDNTLKWELSGPATLVGPAIYEPVMDLPLSNVIRSTGQPGKIHLAAVASGLISGSVDIEAEESIVDNSVISEPVLQDDGRIPVAKLILTVSRLDEIPQEIKPLTEVIALGKSDRTGYKNLMSRYILKLNPKVDTTSIEFRSLISILAFQLGNSEGNLNASDFNYNIDHFNNCRLISGYINSTKLPPLFKDALRIYYAEVVILKGSEKNAGEEMNWLNWIPSGGTVVMVQNEKMNTVPKGMIVAKNTELESIIATVYPQFVNFSDDAKVRALQFIDKMNPYVYQVIPDGGDQAKNSFLGLKGKPILIPLLKFISE